MKSLVLALTLAAAVLPAHAESGRAWLRMNDEELKECSEAVQGLQINPEAVFGKSSDPGATLLRVRTYPRGDQDLLIVESTASKKDDKANQEFIGSIQLKRVAADGSVSLVWEIRRSEHRVHFIPATEIRIAPSDKPHRGPMDFPESKFLRPMSSLERLDKASKNS